MMEELWIHGRPNPAWLASRNWTEQDKTDVMHFSYAYGTTSFYRAGCKCPESTHKLFNKLVKILFWRGV